MIDSAYATAGALTGFVVGMTGIGGGALMTPILLLFFGVNPITAIATDLWFAAVTKIAGAGIHHGTAHVDWQVIKRLWAGSLPIAVATVLFVSLGNSVEQVSWLTKVIGLVTLATALGLLLSPQLLSRARTPQPGNAAGKLKKAQPALTVLGGAAVGLSVSLTSIGAGTLGSVMLMYLYPFRMKPHRLVATDLVHAIPLAMVAGTGYLFAGMVDGQMLLSLLCGSIPAVIFGSLLTRKIHGRGIQMLLAIVLMAAGYKTLL